MSLVVHEIVKLMLKEDAIVVLENLNRSFMQIRGGIEKSVYQKFEKMLIDKLGYIVDKDKAPTENGGALHAIQLADTFENYNKYQSGIVRQCGFIFYVPAWCTSKIDPTTGFVPMLKCKYENIESSQTFFSKFDSIRYNEAEEYFEFKTNYANFYTSSKGGKQQWNICSFGERILTQRAKDGHFESKTIALAPAFKELFAQAGINIQGNIKAQIVKQMMLHSSKNSITCSASRCKCVTATQPLATTTSYLQSKTKMESFSTLAEVVRNCHKMPMPMAHTILQERD